MSDTSEHEQYTSGSDEEDDWSDGMSEEYEKMGVLPPWKCEPSTDWRNARHIRLMSETREHREKAFSEVYGHLSMDTTEFTMLEHTAIATLPPELLVKIFLCLADHDPPRIRESWYSSQTKIVNTPYLGWINITYVCRHWRRIAVCAANLWTDLGHGLVLGPSWTKEFLLRARWANVSIPAFDDYPKVIEMLCDWIVTNSDHIRDLIVSGDWAHDRIPEFVLSDLYPMLESADINAGKYSSLGSFLFHHGAPNLRRLRLCNVRAWKTTGDWTGLVEVDVHHYSCWNYSEIDGSFVPTRKDMLPSLTEFLEVMDELAPTVERLGLHYVLPGYDPDSSLPSRRAHLGRLSSISLSAEAMNVVQFLKHVDFPPNVPLDVTFMPDVSGEGLLLICALLADRVSNLEGQSLGITRIELGAARYGDKLLISAYADNLAERAQCDLALSRRAAEPVLKLSLAYASSQDYIDTFITFFKTMPLHGLDQLTVYGSSNVDAEKWCTIIRDSFAHLQGVRLLVLGQDATRYFFHAIHDRTPSACDERPVAFPQLDILVLRNADISAFVTAMDGVPFEEKMLSVLQDRKDRGCSLRALVFISCQGIDQAWIARLRQVVSPGVVTIGF